MKQEAHQLAATRGDEGGGRSRGRQQRRRRRGGRGSQLGCVLADSTDALERQAVAGDGVVLVHTEHLVVVVRRVHGLRLGGMVW